VVPRAEVDHWINLDTGLARHLMDVSQAVGKAIQRAFQPAKVGSTIIGLEVPHVHIHLVTIDAISDLDFAKADSNPEPDDLDAAADKIRESLRALGYGEVCE